MNVHNYTKLLLTTLVIFGYSSNAYSSEINDSIINTNSDNIIINEQFYSNKTNDIKKQLSKEMQNLYKALDSEKIRFREKLYLGGFDNIHNDIK